SAVHMSPRRCLSVAYPSPNMLVVSFEFGFVGKRSGTCDQEAGISIGARHVSGPSRHVSLRGQGLPHTPLVAPPPHVAQPPPRGLQPPHQHARPPDPPANVPRPRRQRALHGGRMLI